MATVLDTIIKASIVAEFLGAGDLGAQKFTLPAYSDIHLTDGTASNKADRIFADQRSINASSSENLDLAGALADPYGATITFAKVKAILVRAATTNGGNIVVGGAASAAFVGPFGDSSDVLEIPAGGVAMLAAPAGGWPVTATTADILKIANDDSGAAGVYDVVIIGTSA